MKRWQVGWVCILFFIILGCSNIPFQRTAYIPLEQVDPMSVLESYKKGVPEEIHLLNTIVFEYNWQKFSGIGLVAVNTREKRFAVVCINPMGLKLFEISGDQDHTNYQFAMEPLAKNTDFANVVGEDIRRIYFDLVPSPNAEIRKNKYEIVFKQPSGSGSTEYVFAGVGGYLIHKKHYENNRSLWKVSYYEYQVKNGKFYPRGIILDNFKYGYRLIVKLKEIQDNELH